MLKVSKKPLAPPPPNTQLNWEKIADEIAQLTPKHALGALQTLGVTGDHLSAVSVTCLDERGEKYTFGFWGPSFSMPLRRV